MTQVNDEAVVLCFDSPQFNTKHALNNKWTLWYDDPAMAKNHPKPLSWEENLKNVGSFDTIEDFWGIINNLKKPTEIPIAANYHLFKFGIKPMWEEVENRNGGKWTYSLEKKKRGPELDQAWLQTVDSRIPK
jgi:translation initiation factor 4E